MTGGRDFDPWQSTDDLQLSCLDSTFIAYVNMDHIQPQELNSVGFLLGNAVNYRQSVYGKAVVRYLMQFLYYWIHSLNSPRKLMQCNLTKWTKQYNTRTLIRKPCICWHRDIATKHSLLKNLDSFLDKLLLQVSCGKYNNQPLQQHNCHWFTPWTISPKLVICQPLSNLKVEL